MFVLAAIFYVAGVWAGSTAPLSKTKRRRLAYTLQTGLVNISTRTGRQLEQELVDSRCEDIEDMVNSGREVKSIINHALRTAHELGRREGYATAKAKS